MSRPNTTAVITILLAMLAASCGSAVSSQTPSAPGASAPIQAGFESTANLDSKIGHEIMRLLRRIAKEQGRSVVIVSHDQRIRDIADRILWLEDGQFKDVVTMATDPVCGMTVERDRTVSVERDGERFYFCSKGCRDEFLGRLQPNGHGVRHGLGGLLHVASGLLGRRHDF
jgi:YHS domain-containing protein